MASMRPLFVCATENINRITLLSGELFPGKNNVIKFVIMPVAYDTQGLSFQGLMSMGMYLTNNVGIPVVEVSMVSNFNQGYYLAFGTGTMQFIEVYVVSRDNSLVCSNTLRINCAGSLENLGGDASVDGFRWAHQSR